MFLIVILATFSPLVPFPVSCVNDTNYFKFRICAAPTMEFINVLVKYEDSFEIETE